MIRLGIVGFGKRLSSLVQMIFRETDPEFSIVGIVDPDEAGAWSRLDEVTRETASFYPDLDQMVRASRPDGLMIGTRCNLHARYACEAAKYGIPLFLEKPVAVSMEQALKLERVFEAGDCPVTVSFPLRVSPLCEQTRGLLEEGAVGRPEHILGMNYVPYGTVYWEDGYRDYDVTQGLFLQKATHDFDYMMYLMDTPVVRVAAMMTCGRVFGGTKSAGLRCSGCDEARTCPESPENRRRNRSGGVQTDHLCDFGSDCGSSEKGMNEDSSSALLEFASGVHGVYTQVFYSRRDAARRGAVISGYEGTVSFDWRTNEISRVRHHAPFSDVIRGSADASHFGGDSELARDFAALIKHGEAPRAGIREGLQSVYACLAAKESARSGAFAEVRQVGALP
mgnify:CR=1 FL=1